MKYKTERIALALAMLGADPTVASSPATAYAEARRALTKLANHYLPMASPDQNASCVVDDTTGLTYDSTDAADVRRVRTLLALHDLFEALHPGSQLLTYTEREERKAAGWAQASDAGLPMVARMRGAHDVMLAHYSRSACASLDALDPFSFALHPGLNQYLSHYLRACPAAFKTACDGAAFEALLSEYPVTTTSLRIAPGKSYWEVRP